jgi:eukaryotic-like serine/threonine-protein kinase
MVLSAGTRLGPYEILGPLGAGGMGEVYRARDTRLDREVAVKILSDRHVGNPEARARFEREAKAVAALSHPNILALHDVGTSGDLLYAITELLHGSTLAERLLGPPLPLRKTVDFALQIARGLSAAHERGVVHRDLKPENVFVTGEGLVKILDFGLARAALPAAEGGVSRVATLGPATEPGTVLGTVGYMSPEQVRGQALDARSDLFSFGAVLYEMLTGRRAFQADTAADTMSSILREEPPEAAASGRAAPPALDRIVRHCLEKNPAERFQSARDLIFSLEAVASSWDSAEGKAAVAAAPRATALRRVPIRALAILLLGGALGVAAALVWGQKPPGPPPILRTLTYSGTDSDPSASFDGRLIAYASEREGRRRIWLKQHPGGDEVALTSGPDSLPRISPDGTQVLFVRHEQERDALFRIPVVGGEPRRVLDDAYEGDWSPDGRRIVFLRRDDSTRSVSVGVADASGEGARIVATVAGRLEYVRWSPAGNQVAMRRLEGENSPQVLLLVDVAEGSQRTLVPPPPSGAVSGPAWSADGRALIFGQLESFVFTNVAGGAARIVRQEIASSRAETLMWIPSPADVVDILGPGRLLMNIRSQRANLMEVPLGGTSAAAARGRWLTRGSSVDRQPAVSPDGRWVISSSNRAGNLDLWKLSLSDGSLRRVTEDAADDWDPAFTPDGRSILWSSSRSGHFEIWMCDADGTRARQVTNDGFDAENPTMTPDGLWVVYSSSNPEHSGLWKIHPDGSGATRLVPGSWSTPEVSPDGRWVVFRSQAVPRVLHVARVEDGELQPFPIEIPGGLFTARARWMPGGRALAFIALDTAGALGVQVQDFVPGRDTRTSRRILSAFDPELPVESFGIAPDGSRVIYSRYERSTALMLAEGLPGIAPPTRPAR